MMKYGRMAYIRNYPIVASKNNRVNMGDWIQAHAVKHLYDYMGIPQEKRIDLEISGALDDAMIPDDDYVILPFCKYEAMDRITKKWPFSSKIIPFFWSMHLSSPPLNNMEINYLKSYQPIGCRDRATADFLRQYGIEAYTTGCLTLTLPDRVYTPKEQKTFFVDVPKELWPYVPKPLLKNYKEVSASVSIPYAETKKQDLANIDKICSEFYLELRQEATLVVTQRLHVASPCLAMGIPVIFILPETSANRVYWLDKLLPIYMYQEFGSIDWNPSFDWNKIKQIKERMLQGAVQQLNKLAESRQAYCDISCLFEQENKKNYGEGYWKYLNEMRQFVAADKKFEYIIWGYGVWGFEVYKQITLAYPNAKAIAFADQFKEGETGWLPIIKPQDIITQYPNAYIIIANYSGEKAAREQMKAWSKQEGRDFMSFNTRINIDKTN